MFRPVDVQLLLHSDDDGPALFAVLERVVADVQSQARQKGVDVRITTRSEASRDESARAEGRRPRSSKPVHLFVFRRRAAPDAQVRLAELRGADVPTLVAFPQAPPLPWDFQHAEANLDWARLLQLKDEIGSAPAGAPFRVLASYDGIAHLESVLVPALLQLVMREVRPAPTVRPRRRGDAKRPAKARRAPARPRTEEVWPAFLLVADTVRFSEQDHRIQLELVRHALDGLLDHPLLQQAGERSIVLSTGDGFIVALPQAGAVDLPAHVCDLAAHLIRHERRYTLPGGAPAELRIGLHVGELTTTVSTRAPSFAAGTGLNWCSRIADLAAPSQVLASEEFVRVLAGRSGAASGRWYPEQTEPPFLLAVKHGRKAQFRILRHPELGEDGLRPPPKAARAQQIGAHLRQALSIVVASLVEVLADPGEDESAARVRLRARVTLWEPDGDHLRAINPRFELTPTGVKDLRSSETRWRLRDDQGDVMGPVSAAFQTGAPGVLLGLPDPDVDKEAYQRRWEEVGVPRSVVDKFGRDSRAVLTLPLSLFGNPAAGVLCIDLMDPLAGYGEHRALDLLNGLQRVSGYFLAALLHLRAA